MKRLMRVLPLLLLAACLGDGPLQQKGASAPALSPADRDFLQITFGQDYALEDTGRLHRWETAVHYRFTGEAPLEHQREILPVLDQLETLTGLSISMENPATPANFFIHLLDADGRDVLVDRQFPRQPRLRRALKKAACFFLVSAGGDGVIRRADVVLPVHLDRQKFRHCAHEELAQALGLPGDLPEGRESIFSEGFDGTGYTDVDLRQIRRLYQRDMRAGLTRDQVRDRLAGSY